MKSQHRGGERESRSRDPASSQIADDHPTPRDAIELRDERKAMIVVEVMEKLGTEDDVDTAIGEGESEGVGADGVIHAMARGGHEVERTIDRDRAQCQAPAPGDLARAPGKVGASRADVEQGRLGPPGSRR